MQKRSEATRQEKVFFRTKLKHTVIIVFCIIFALSTIYAVDISTYKLIGNDKDQYAMRVTSPDENTLRVDFVGKHYNMDIKNIKAYTSKLMTRTKTFIEELTEKVK